MEDSYLDTYMEDTLSHAYADGGYDDDAYHAQFDDDPSPYDGTYSDGGDSFDDYDDESDDSGGDNDYE